MNETRASVENFDLGQHAVVEASAGTGKTYTIETLVLRLLTEEDVPLERILVVTFTEKATGELKIRLRGVIERALKEQDDHADRLKAALDHFDQAPIFTIHGFCYALMQEYALEQGQDFRAEQVKDEELLATLLGEIQRKDWRRAFGDRLRAVLEHANYGRASASAWDDKVLEIARRYKPRSGHRLRPEFRADWWRHLDDADANAAGQLEIFTIDRLHERLREVKRQRGLVSFDDMIATVEESLDPMRNPDAERFVDVLRERYRYGIVDEFQDTDPLQWRIFRRIFCDGGASKLFVVGDPKQAIFGFRGADLPTYLDAARQMKADFGAFEYPLKVNWRSDPNLIEALNCVFGDGDWFSRQSGIRYWHVHAPDDDVRQSRIEVDRSNRAALSLVDLTHCDRIKLAQKRFARFIAHEIDRMLRGPDGPLLSITRKSSPPRPIDAGDFCVLVMKRAEAEPITAALDTAGIPYSFYKQLGLWKSEEATHLEVLLQSLAQPEDRASFRKALLTCFFRVTPAELAAAPDVPMHHPARRLYQSWLDFAESRAWSALFRSLLEDTGLLFRPPDETVADRRVANLRQLLATLEQIGHGFNHDLLGLLDWMRQRRETNEADVQPDEAGRPKVKIMTIHASKGLEFPIVFLAGGFTKGRDNSSLAVYHDQNQLVLDLCPEADAQGRVKAEQLDEQRRLLYVALTRAIFKLYVPKVKIPRGSGGYLGPVGTILHPALENACPDKLGPMIADVVTPPLDLSASPRPESVRTDQSVSPIALKGPLFAKIDADLGKRRIVVRSFSGMAKHHLAQVGAAASFGEQPRPIADETPTPPDHDDPMRGPVFGDMVHNVLEHIDFAEAAKAATPDDLQRAGAHARRIIDREIHANLANLRSRAPIDKLDELCRRQIANLVWHALRTPLAELGGPLCDIAKTDRLHEVDFLFPEIAADAFVTGFMDLLFRKSEKYYLLDWKTNLLPAYGREPIERSMSDSDYHRQYRLYLNAARRWLERMHGPAFSFFERFGGVYYLYVRGMNGHDETAGVFFHRPTEAELELASLLT